MRTLRSATNIFPVLPTVPPAALPAINSAENCCAWTGRPPRRTAVAKAKANIMRAASFRDLAPDPALKPIGAPTKYRCRPVRRAAPECDGWRRDSVSTRLMAFISLGERLSDRLIEIEGVEQVVERRHVGRNVGVGLLALRIRQIVAAAASQRPKLPIPLDEFYQRDVVGIAVIDLAAGRVRRQDQQRDARAITEEVDRLNEARVVVATRLVPRDEHGRVGLQRRIGVEGVEDVLYVGLEQVDFRARRMTVEHAVRLADGDRGQRAVLDLGDHVDGILEVDRRIV